MNIQTLFANIILFSLISCKNYNSKDIIDSNQANDSNLINKIIKTERNICDSNKWKDFPLIIGIQNDKIVLSGFNIGNTVSSQSISWGQPDSITFFDTDIYDEMYNDYEIWHYGESRVILQNKKISDFYIEENNFVLNKPIYAEIYKTRCKDFRDYVNCECENILDAKGNGSININIISNTELIVTDAFLYFNFENHYLKSFGLNSRIF